MTFTRKDGLYIGMDPKFLSCLNSSCWEAWCDTQLNNSIRICQSGYSHPANGLTRLQQLKPGSRIVPHYIIDWGNKVLIKLDYNSGPM